MTPPILDGNDRNQNVQGGEMALRCQICNESNYPIDLVKLGGDKIQHSLTRKVKQPKKSEGR